MSRPRSRSPMAGFSAADRLWLSDHRRKVDCGALRVSPGRRCGVCFACEMAAGEDALTQRGRH